MNVDNFCFLIDVVLGNRCYVLGCSTKYDSDSPKIPHFQAPGNSFARKKWLDISLRKHPKLKGNFFFCTNHFEESDIIKSKKKIFLIHLNKLMLLKQFVRNLDNNNNNNNNNMYL